MKIVHPQMTPVLIYQRLAISLSGPHFTNCFSIAIQIRWKFRCTLIISILIQWLQQNFAHGTTAVLSWHVQNFVAIWWPVTELQQGKVYFNCGQKIVSETGPSPWFSYPPIVTRNVLIQPDQQLFVHADICCDFSKIPLTKGIMKRLPNIEIEILSHKRMKLF